MAGYSGTPLAGKLGIKAGTRLHVAEAPENYRELVAPLPPDVTLQARPSSATSIVHLFATKRSDLARRLTRFRESLRPDAAVWISWPKKSSKVPTDITEDVVREVALPLGYVDIKVCA